MIAGGKQALRLAATLLPVGELTKAEVRDRAAAAGLRVATKPDSYDVCFIPDGDTAGWLARELGERPGPIVDRAGRELGRHGGVFGYTVGQRRGLGLGGGPWYVVDVLPATNTLVVGGRADLLVSRFHVTATNWVSAVPEPGERLAADIEVRYNMTPVRGTVTVGRTGTAAVELAEPFAGVTPGQAAVFYDGARVLGGGWIVRRVGTG